VCCSVLECVGVRCTIHSRDRLVCVLQCVAVCWSVLQCVALHILAIGMCACCSEVSVCSPLDIPVLQCVAACWSVLECVGVC